MEKLFLDNSRLIELMLLLGIVGLLIWKLIHYSKNKTQRTGLSGFFYFSEYNIINSKDEQRREFKRKQNNFSKAMVLLIILGAIIYLI